MINLFLFVFSVVGLTHIIVDPSTIVKPFRDFIEKKNLFWLNKLLSCYQCCGTWVGFFCGYVLLTQKPLEVFLCGMAGSFLSTLSALFLNYLEAQTIINENE